MKANEAPEKIYLNQDDGLIWHCRSYKDDIEYTRTDAFIKKASEWLSKHAIKYYLDSSKFLGTDELVEDFKIAMTL